MALDSAFRDLTLRRARILRNLLSDPLPRDKELVFEGYDYVYPEVAFHFTAMGRSYCTRMKLGAGVPQAAIDALPARTREIVFGVIGLALAPFHFLLSDFSAIRVRHPALPCEVLDFFSSFLPRGLGEFRYRQGLDPTRPIRVYGSTAGNEPARTRLLPTDRSILLLNGGGKDTAVMAEILKATGLDCAWCSIGLGVHQKEIAAASGIDRSIVLGFRLDPAIRGHGRYPWGHIPHSSLYMSMALVPALALGYRYVTTGNECSANFGNLRFKGEEINHQYTKSYEFEVAFDSMVRTHIASDLQFFSALRPLHDLRIASMLSTAPAYFGKFVSCNIGPGWCCRCPKCAFTYLCLAAFLAPEDLRAIFGEDLFKRRDVRQHIRYLVEGTAKPWECVGTQEESRAALALVRRRFDADWIRDLDRPDAMDPLARIFRLHEPHNLPFELRTDMLRKAEEMTPRDLVPDFPEPCY